MLNKKQKILGLIVFSFLFAGTAILFGVTTEHCVYPDPTANGSYTVPKCNVDHIKAFHSGQKDCVRYQMNHMLWKGGNEINETDLSKAYLPDSSFSKVKLIKMKMHDTNLRKAIFAYNTQLINCDLQNADFSHSFYNGVKFIDTDAKFTKFEKANFNYGDGVTSFERTEKTAQKGRFFKANFKEANMNKVNMMKMIFWECDFSKAKFTEGYAEETAFNKSNFTNANLTKTSFNYSDMEDAVFDKATCVETRFDNSMVKNVSFKNANLRNSNFMGATIVNTDFSNADLRGAYFESLKMNISPKSKNNFKNADVSGAHFLESHKDWLKKQGVKNFDKIIWTKM